MAIHQLREMGVVAGEKALDQERVIAVAWFWITGTCEESIVRKPAPTGSASTAALMHSAKLTGGGLPAMATASGAESNRSRQRLKTEILPQRPHQQAKLNRWLQENEPGVVMQRRGVFMAPHATGAEVDDLLAAIAAGDFQA